MDLITIDDFLQLFKFPADNMNLMNSRKYKCNRNKEHKLKDYIS